MNVMNRVTLKSMRKNRTRTVVTIIGIILSAAMFTAVLTITTTLYNHLYENEVYESGSYHVYARHVSADEVREVREDGRVEYVSLGRILGYANIDSANKARPYICLEAFDEAFLRNMPVHVTGGRLPENSSEIILPEHMVGECALNYGIGDTVALELGSRLAALDSPDGAGPGGKLYQESAFSGDAESLTPEKTLSLTVVGIYERPDFEPFTAPGYTVITRLEGESDDGVYECYLRVKDPIRNYAAFKKEHGPLFKNGYESHESLLTMEGASSYDNINAVLAGFAFILCLLIFIGSVSLIYSAFSISVSERTREFGLLASVGATRRQLRRSVITEALTLSAIGIPIGVLTGIGGIALTFLLLKDKLADVFVVSKLPLYTRVTWPGVLAAVLIALVTVLISAWIPSRRAMRISPMEAIRRSRDISARKKAVKTSRLTLRLFGAEGMLAKKYYKRSSKKYRATIVSLVMSVILFITASSFATYLTASASSADQMHQYYDGAYGFVERNTFERIRGTLAAQATEFAGYYTEYQHCVYAPDSDLTSDYVKFLDDLTEHFSDPIYPVSANLYYIDDVSFRELLKAHGLSGDGFFDHDSPKAVIVNKGRYTMPRVIKDGDDFKKEYVTYAFDFLKPGTKKLLVSRYLENETGYYIGAPRWSGGKYGEGDLVVTLEPMGNYTGEYDENGAPTGLRTVKLEFDEVGIGALVDERYVGGAESSYMEIYLPFSVCKTDIINVQFFFRSDNVRESISNMTRIMEDAGVTVSDDGFYDVTELQRRANDTVTIVKVFSYGFIALISLICAANVFNTISTNVALRRRDYAMLRSMGMTEKGLRRMSNYECLIYGAKALLFGLPISLLLSYLIYYYVITTEINLPFTLPWGAAAIAVISVFAVVFASMLYSTNKLKKGSPIDALKDESA